MNSTAATLEKVGDHLAGLVGDVFAGDDARGWSERDVLEILSAAARITRAGEALLVEATAQVCDRSDGRLNADRMTTRFGCRSTSELVQRTTRVSTMGAADLVKAARAVVRPVALTSGEVLPARLPAMRAALAAVEVGVDGVIAVAGPLLACGAGTAAVHAADGEIAATARGEGADAAPPASAEELRALATVWAMYLDQDGSEPREDRAMRKRGITVGPCRDGLHPVRGHVLPEVAGQLQRALDSVLNPKVDGAVALIGPLFRESGAGGQTVDPGDPDAPFTATADDRTRPQNSTTRSPRSSIPSPRRAHSRRSEAPRRHSWCRCVRTTLRPVVGSRTSKAPTSRSPSLPHATSPAQAPCSASSSTTPAASSPSAISSAPSHITSAERSVFETAGASFPAAMSLPHGARSTMSRSIPEVDRPTPKTASCSAGSITALSTPAGGWCG